MIASSRTSTSRWIQKPAGPSFPLEVSERVAHRPLDASLTHVLQIHRTQGRREWLASLGGGKLGVAEPEHHRVLVAHERSSALEVRDNLGTASGDERKLHRRSLARGLGLGLVEVGVSVEEQQAVAAAASERERVPEQDAAVAAEHDWERAV